MSWKLKQFGIRFYQWVKAYSVFFQSNYTDTKITIELYFSHRKQLVTLLFVFKRLLPNKPRHIVYVSAIIIQPRSEFHVPVKMSPLQIILKNRMPKVKLNSITPANENQKKFADDGIIRLETVINNPIFLQEVVNAKYTWKKLWTDQGILIEATNQQIADIITNGKERMTIPNDIINLQITLAVLRSGTVGSVSPPNPLITTNTLFFDPWMSKGDSLSIAAHWMHEWLHVAGFLHKNKKVDENDVNYTIGRLVVEVGKQIAQAKGEPESLISTLGCGYLDSIKEHSNDVDMDNVEVTNI